MIWDTIYEIKCFFAFIVDMNYLVAVQEAADDLLPDRFIVNTCGSVR